MVVSGTSLKAGRNDAVQDGHNSDSRQPRHLTRITGTLDRVIVPRILECIAVRR
jgi:hypothetical protein